MKITSDDIANLAALSRLSAHEGSEEKVAGDLTQILSYVEKLRDVKKSALSPRVARNAGEMRGDAIAACPQDQREWILRNAPQRTGDLLATPAIF